MYVGLIDVGPKKRPRQTILYFLQKEIVCEESTGQRNQAKLCLGASNSKEF